MSCKDYAWKIGPYVDGELPTAEGSGVETHLRNCSECSQMARSFRALDHYAGSLDTPAVSGKEWARIFESVTEKKPHGVYTSRRSNWEWLLPVASVAALILLSFVIGSAFFGGDQDSRPGNMAAGGKETGSQEGGSPSFAQNPDGSQPTGLPPDDDEEEDSAEDPKGDINEM